MFHERPKLSKEQDTLLLPIKEKFPKVYRMIDLLYGEPSHDELAAYLRGLIVDTRGDAIGRQGFPADVVYAATVFLGNLPGAYTDDNDSEWSVSKLTFI